MGVFGGDINLGARETIRSTSAKGVRAFELLGINEFTRRLEALEGPKAKRIINQALKKAAQPVFAHAWVHAPRGVTRRLVNSIEVRKLKRSRKTLGYAVMTLTKEEMGIPAETTGYYPAYMELGLPARPARAGFRGRKRALRARRFLRNAMDAKRRTALEIIKEHVGRKLAQLAQVKTKT